MSIKSVAARFLVASTVLVLFGVGCGSAGGGGGCGGLRPLPSANNQPDPAPLGLPTDQVIEGGLQARITKPGLDKLTGALVNLIKGQLGSGLCAVREQDLVGDPGSLVHLVACDATHAECPDNHKGCVANIVINSVKVSVPDSTTPVITIDTTLDYHFGLYLDYRYAIGSGSCTMDINNGHYTDAGKAPVHIIANIELGTDPATGELTLHLQTPQIPSIDLQANGCGFLGDAFSILGDFLSSTLGNILINFVVGLLQPQLDALLQSFLPKPLGLAGVLDTGNLLASFHPPKDANLEMFIVPGGYVATKGGGLNLGVMSGVNSDRDETTRQPGMTSEPSLCVPVRPTPELAQAPWNLPYNAARKDYLLSPANEFSGMPDPTDAMGNTQDVAIGLSRTFLDLVGFHAYNSGTLCLDIGGDAIPQLNAGTLSVIVGSLGNILEDQKAPLALVLRPQTPIDFTIGAGDMNDPLLHIGINDMRIDFYGWIEERYVRLLTLGVDINVGLNLTVTKTADGKPAIQPMLVGVDAKNVTIRVSNTDLLQEKPEDLAAVFPSLINIATGALGGAIKPIALPAVAGFSLDGLKIQRVQTSQDDFIGIFGTIVAATPSPLIDWSDPAHPQLAGSLHTTARVTEVRVPKPVELQALFADKLGVKGARPMVKLALDAGGNDGREVEWAWRVDGGMWRPWTRDPSPVLSDDAFLLQGHHRIDVRSRVVDQWSTESQPVSLDVLIDSVAPELHPARDEKDHALLDLGGFDLVSDAAKLKYAWLGADGKATPWTSDATMPWSEALAVTDNGKKQLVLYAVDEAGNVGQGAFDLGSLGFHGRTTAPSPSGCNCDVGGHGDGGAGARGGFVALALMALVFLRRQKRALAPLLVVVALGLFVTGCGCGGKNQCRIDDDCAKMQCDPGEVPACMENECGCTPDVAAGDVGRFSSMTLIGNDAYVAAYNNTYGDLMIGHVTPPGVVQGWDFVDGVPDEPPDITNSHTRGGVTDNGDDVGRYTSIGTSSTNEPIIAYYDKTHGALKFAIFGAIRWHTYVVDSGTGTPDSGGDDIGKWASMSVGPDGLPGIAYSAWVKQGMSGEPESQLRWAQATVPNPTSPSDWQITVVDSRRASDSGAPVGDMGAPDMAVGPDMADADAGPPPMMPDPLLPEGVAIMASAARKPDGSPGIAYYDRTRGNLRLVEWNASTNAWNTPMILDGEDAQGDDLGDVGLYNSLVYDGQGTAHISYENATLDHLYYINTMAKTPEVVDDGYHPADEQTQDGIDSPVWHLVGDSSSIKLAPNGVVIAYQDSTVLMLRLAVKGADGKWQKQYVAGHAMPFTGAYGFYADLEMKGGDGVLSSYAINQQLPTPSFYVEVFSVSLGLIQ